MDKVILGKEDNVAQEDVSEQQPSVKKPVLLEGKTIEENNQSQSYPIRKIEQVLGVEERGVTLLTRVDSDPVGVCVVVIHVSSAFSTH